MRTYEYMVRCLARSGYLNSAMKTLREMRGMFAPPFPQLH
jgi:pentatricopeptide repeat protein